MAPAVRGVGVRMAYPVHRQARPLHRRRPSPQMADAGEATLCRRRRCVMVSCSRGSTTRRRARFALAIVAVALCSARVPTQSAAHYGILDLGTLGGAAAAGYGISE